jgi:predicted small lipoprotein YifL
MAGVNAAPADIQAVVDFLQKNAIRPVAVALLPSHATGVGKRARLGLPPGDVFAPPTAAALDALAEMFRAAGFQRVTLGG